MLVQEIIEAQQWERFKGSSSSRVWFNALTDQAITTNDDGNHSVGIINNKELFGITDQELSQLGVQPGESVQDYDGRVLYAAMQKGWVRLYVDARSPDTASNIEATNLRFARRGLVWYSEQIGPPMRIVIVIRHGAGDRDGTPYPLIDAEQVDLFIRHGTIPQSRLAAEPTRMQQGLNVTPHAFRKF